jgi:transposase
MDKQNASIMKNNGGVPLMSSSSRFNKEFKEQTVNQVLSGERTASEIAKELGVHYTTIRDWVKSYKQDGTQAFPGSGHLKPDDEDLRKLRRENANLREENEILKKAAAYFAKNLR